MRIISTLLFSLILVATGACDMNKNFDNPDAEARFQKALDYQVGKKRGEKRDILKARELYLEAIELGSTKALINLANLYLRYDKKLGVTEEKAYCYYLEYSQEAANKGRPEGYVNLYASYYNGDCVTQDKEKAMMFLHKAADMGHGSALFRLGDIERKKDPKNPKAVEWYKQSLEVKYSKAAEKLYFFYERDDLKKAISYLKEGAKLGDKSALYLLSSNYIEGDRGFSKNVALGGCYKKMEEEASKNWNEVSDIPDIIFPDLDERCPPDMKDK